MTYTLVDSSDMGFTIMNNSKSGPMIRQIRSLRPRNTSVFEGLRHGQILFGGN